ncbi:MAG: hypothetical protein U9P00_05530, partial [Pseudomonadota bacterium]|nr:hypothetical protein [Pseudomonadota bacterium]
HQIEQPPMRVPSDRTILSHETKKLCATWRLQGRAFYLEKPEIRYKLIYSGLAASMKLPFVFGEPDGRTPDEHLPAITCQL